MGWVMMELELPPEEDAIGKAWLEQRPFQEFFEWCSEMLRIAAEQGDGGLRERVLGKILEHAGKGLQVSGTVVMTT